MSTHNIKFIFITIIRIKVKKTATTLVDMLYLHANMVIQLEELWLP